MDTEISHRGYSITLATLPPHFLNNIKSELFVKPLENPNFPSNDPAYPVYRISKTKIYMPRFYGIEKYSQPKKNILKNGETIDLEFNSKLFIKQFTREIRPFRDFINWVKESITNVYGMNQCMDSLGEYDKEQFFDELSEIIDRDNKNGHFNILIPFAFIECFSMGVIPFSPGEIIVFLERLNKYYIHHHIHVLYLYVCNDGF